jgi:regulatory protein YycI of two-component signal transduction system YycFG
MPCSCDTQPHQKYDDMSYQTSTVLTCTFSYHTDHVAPNGQVLAPQENVNLQEPKIIYDS